VILDVLYHWSPRERRVGITRLGLVPGKRPTAPGGTMAVTDWEQMICLGPTAHQAWRLSAHAFGSPYGWWDLWEVALDEKDAVHLVPQWGPRLREVRVANRIPKRRVVWVAEREMPHPADAAER
jgi:hypothetical protein